MWFREAFCNSRCCIARETFVIVLVRFVMFLGTMLKIAKCDSERILQFSSVSLREKKCWKLVNMVPRSFCNCCWIWKRENVWSWQMWFREICCNCRCWVGRGRTLKIDERISKKIFVIADYLKIAVHRWCLKIWLLANDESSGSVIDATFAVKYFFLETRYYVQKIIG